MSASASITPGTRAVKSSPWWEIALVIALYLVLTLLAPGLKQILALPILLYMIIESWLRHRSWAENGFGIRSILPGFRQTIGWGLLVAFGTQALFILGEKVFLPEVFAHILGRVPYDVSALNAALFIPLAIATFLEELLFRALFQNRLSAFVSPAAAIGIVSVVFAFAHFSPGSGIVVFFDLLSIFVDSLIFGIIFQRSKNVFVAWVPHYIADVFALILILMVK
jgi:uncharacterized protein